MRRYQYYRVIFMLITSLCFSLIITSYRMYKQENGIDIDITMTTDLATQAPDPWLQKVNSALEQRDSVIRNCTPVLITTYQRSGSTFLGSIFSHDPDVFYWFEPLDGLYWSLYGIPAGYTIPSDLVVHKDGQFRVILERESEAITQSLIDIFTCNFTNLPTEILLHPFHITFRKKQPSLSEYTECVTDEVIQQASKCSSNIRGRCPGRPSPYNSRHDVCFKELSAKDLRGYYITNRTQGREKLSFNVYKNCLNKFRKKALECVHLLQTACLQSSFRVVKAIRLTMEDAVRPLSVIPHLRIIHSVRHPLGIARSRRKEKGYFVYMSPYANGDVNKEARIVCSQLYKDLLKSSKLKAVHSTPVQTLSYENLSKEPIKTVHSIYKFLGRTSVPDKVMGWVNSTTKDSVKLSEGWTASFTIRDYLNLKQHCKALFDTYSNEFGWI